jgi:hypothetical protein
LIAILAWCLALAVIAAGLWLKWLNAGRPGSPDPRAVRSEITGLYDAMALGLTWEQARSVVERRISSHLTLHELSRTNWIVQSSMEDGARNWDLWIEFQDAQVSAVMVRSADSRLFHPPDAPVDKQ